jgi:Leucine-rich repeat (LRR) protein
MAGLEGLSALTSLSLKDNQLSGLQGLGELPTLQHLALDSNELKMVSAA